MDTQNPSAPSRARARSTAHGHPNRRPEPGGGLTHDNTRHTTRFTVIGNHLTQHAELSLLAIGLACHIQSLPQGARVDIKSLTLRFPEGATRIAAALRELEAHGYLRRERVRAPGGRIVTRTVSCNQPGSRGREEAPDARRTATPAAPRRPAAGVSRRRAGPAGHRTAGRPAPPRPAPAPVRPRHRPSGPRRRRLAGAGREPGGRGARPHRRPAGRAPAAPLGPAGPPPHRPAPTPATVRGPVPAPTGPPSPPELRHLRPSLPLTHTRTLP